MNRKKILLILLGLVLGYGLFTFWSLSRRPAKQIAKKDTNLLIVREVGAPRVVIETKSSAPTKEAALAQKQKPAPKKVFLVDPFALRLAVQGVGGAAGKEGAPVASGPILEGIWVDPKLRAAFISGQVVTEGEDVLGWRIRKIAKDQVDLVKQNQVMILRLEDIYESE
ncbi:MAG: hypothetical protein ABIH69_00365 [bacterium]